MMVILGTGVSPAKTRAPSSTAAPWPSLRELRSPPLGWLDHRRLLSRTQLGVGPAQPPQGAHSGCRLKGSMQHLVSTTRETDAAGVGFTSPAPLVTFVPLQLTCQKPSNSTSNSLSPR